MKDVGSAWVVLAQNQHLSLRVGPVVRDASHKANVVIWTAGVSANEQWRAWGLPVNEHGYVRINDTFQVLGHGDVWAIGDMAAMEEMALPQIAPEAIAQGATVAENAYRRFKRETSFRHYRATTWPWAIPLGGRHAIAHYRGLTVSGWLGYLFRKAVDLKYFLDILKPMHALRVWLHGARVYLQND